MDASPPRKAPACGAPRMHRRYSGSPLACVSSTTVECRPGPGSSPAEGDRRALLRRSSLSSRASSTFFDIHSFPPSADLVLPAHSEFAAPLTPTASVDRCQRTPFCAPTALVMDLKKLSDHGAACGGSGSGSGSRSGSQESLEPSLSLSSASDASGELSAATREAMDTPLVAGQAQTPAPRKQKPRPVQLLGRESGTPKAMTETVAGQLRPALPVEQRLAKSWRLVYSMDQHGISMHTMLERCAGEKALVLAVKDTTNRVFGAFLSETLRLSPAFYGQGTSFLWKAFRASPESRKKNAVRCFRYTGENEYFILCDPGFVAVGGGRGKFGLWLKADFLHGSSAHCPTFNNQPLCLDPAHPQNDGPDAQQEFTVGHLELWAFDAH
ncbi:oxidation resistance protein 1 [Coemansia helicoidea]|uniref:Oxidation resistance protein 1 n=1 Tax=Coemansia helicoidea TaxID=1286919 RepID=A0ACC1L6X9_9FUNG|nr:oxidation resistance protein 1 [Coemansia helicoidea]